MPDCRAENETKNDPSIVDIFLEGQLMTEATVIVKALDNPKRSNVCFLNSPLQALWNVEQFRECILLVSEHCNKEKHNVSLNNCLFCAIQKLFVQYQDEDFSPVLSAMDVRESLLSVRHGDISDMGDSVETLEDILEYFHENKICMSGNNQLDGSEPTCSCQEKCIAHQCFGMDLSQRFECSKCGTVLSQSKCTVFHIPILVEQLLVAQHPLTSLDYTDMLRQHDLSLFISTVLMKSVTDRKCSCFGCTGSIHDIQHLDSDPRILTLSCVYRSPDSLSPLHLIRLYELVRLPLCIESLKTNEPVDPSLSNPSLFFLRGMVCFYSIHYVCLWSVPSLGEDEWLLYDDTNVQWIHGTESALEHMWTRRFQPVLLFYTNEKTSDSGMVCEWEKTNFLLPSHFRSLSSEHGSLESIEGLSSPWDRWLGEKDKRGNWPMSPMSMSLSNMPSIRTVWKNVKGKVKEKDLKSVFRLSQPSPGSSQVKSPSSQVFSRSPPHRNTIPSHVYTTDVLHEELMSSIGHGSFSPSSNVHRQSSPSSAEALDQPCFHSDGTLLGEMRSNNRTRTSASPSVSRVSSADVSPPEEYELYHITCKHCGVQLHLTRFVSECPSCDLDLQFSSP